MASPSNLSLLLSLFTISFGLLIDQYPFSIGISNGYEWFRNFDKSGKKIWNSKNYYDLQSNTLESITRE